MTRLLSVPYQEQKRFIYGTIAVTIFALIIVNSYISA